MTGIKRLFTLAALAGCTMAAGAAGITIFGDSLSDVGNDAVILGSNGSQPINNGYIPDQPYASGQFSNGDVWAKAFSVALGVPAAGAPSLLGGSNFAFGGARVATDGSGLAPSLQAQVNMFMAASGGVAASQSLYVVEGGGNDARDTLVAAAFSATPATVIGTAAAAYALAVGQIVDQLQGAGAQRIVVWNVPNLGLAPAVTAQGGAGLSYLASQVTLAMNGALAARLSTEGAGVSIFDDFGLISAWAANPAAYGLVNVTDACGGVVGCDPSSYLFWDGIHPTSAGHALLAAAAVPEPATAGLWLAGLLVTGLWLRGGRFKR